MKSIAQKLFAVSALAFAAQAGAQVSFYENEAFQGRSFTTTQRIGNMQGAGFNDRASSVIVTGQRWQVCDDVRFEGRCMVVRPGQYPSLQAMGLNDRISSVRPLQANAHVEERDYAPMPVVAQDYRRRHDERLYDAEVTSARAVVGGAVGGAALGSQYGHNAAAQPITQDVRRCDSNPAQATPSYWDVTYQF